ncbi:hypothetical protein J3998_12305 [Thiomicrorhabdus sp. 6S2-11]|jgi:uncharacterized coiled-coil protein SlyX|uniref:Uncharacterized protein n=1 Tax=Thiomicrorhabdus marina TaxID=2818442 RepID=A0ABS3Q7V6_9GAMM|nr:hypothetical protein [Thiomicrorhabdus marina]MBO1928357.1 hypothetical protein [Thiomicrorhabdus marina]
MRKTMVMTVVLSALILFEGVAAAASISTRVRILEGKVAQQERTVKQVSQSSEAQQQRFDQGMNKVQQLERKVKTLDKKFTDQFEQKHKQASSGQDKRYAYP